MQRRFRKSLGPIISVGFIVPTGTDGGSSRGSVEAETSAFSQNTLLEQARHGVNLVECGGGRVADFAQLNHAA